jgi:hypothetical protein
LAWAGLWTWRAVWPGGADWKRGAVTLMGWLAAATAVPIGLELAWTGATLAEWWHNVAGLPAERRGLLAQLASPALFLQPPHAYYRPLWLRPVGLVGSLVVLATAVSLWPARGAVDRGWLVVATLGALASGAALLATNFEIALLGAAAYLALAVALVVGFASAGAAGAAGERERATWAGLAAAALALLAWPSAWAGARSQFGHAVVPRSEYVRGEDLPPRFDYLRGLRVLPQYAESLRTLDRWIESGAVAPDGRGLLPVKGTEWLSRALPGARAGGLPLWFHHGTTYGPANEGAVAIGLLRPGRINYLLADPAWDVWQGLPRMVVERHFTPVLLGPALQLHVRRNDDPLSDPFATLVGARTNLDARRLRFAGQDRDFYEAGPGRFLGGTGQLELRVGASSYRLTGEAVLQAYPAAGRPRRAIFRAVVDEAGAEPEELWRAELEVSAREVEQIVEFELRPEGRPVRFEVWPQADRGEGLVAGWRNLLSLHSGPLDGGAPAGLVGAFGTPQLLPPEALLAGGASYSIFGYGAGFFAVAGGGLGTFLPGELWLRVDQPVRRIAGRYRVERGAEAPPEIAVRAIWSRAGRVEVLHEQRFVPDAGDPNEEAGWFDAHFPEPIGWFGLLASAWPKGTPAPGVRVVWERVEVEP